jgi:hypothetical protein
VWLLGEDRRTDFAGDQVHGRKHAYLADGYHAEWLANLDRLREELPQDATLFIDGEPVSPAQIEWQRQLGALPPQWKARLSEYLEN